MITLKDVKKTYVNADRKVEALKGVSLEVKKGEIFGIIGYSGSGKSTLLRCINQLEKVDSGEIIVNGKKMNEITGKELRDERQKIGMIFQHFNLLSSYTVYQNVAFPLVYKGVKKEEIKKKVNELLELVGLSEKKNFYPSQLSGGQKQRVSIARALANDPEVLLSDEATSALDPETTEAILNLLKDLNKKLNLTIVLITHEMQVIKEICDRVAVLDGGKIVEEGSAIEIFSKPKNVITKKFVDSVFNNKKIYELIENPSIASIVKNQGIIARLVFIGASANDSYLTRIAQNHNINISVIFGNIEVIQDEPLGCIFVAFMGDLSRVSDAIDEFRSSNIEVTFIKGKEYFEKEVV